MLNRCELFRVHWYCYYFFAHYLNEKEVGLGFLRGKLKWYLILGNEDPFDIYLMVDQIKISSFACAKNRMTIDFFFEKRDRKKGFWKSSAQTESVASHHKSQLSLKHSKDRFQLKTRKKNLSKEFDKQGSNFGIASYLLRRNHNPRLTKIFVSGFFAVLAKNHFLVLWEKLVSFFRLRSSFCYLGNEKLLWLPGDYQVMDGWMAGLMRKSCQIKFPLNPEKRERKNKDVVHVAVICVDIFSAKLERRKTGFFGNFSFFCWFRWKTHRRITTVLG